MCRPLSHTLVMTGTYNPLSFKLFYYYLALFHISSEAAYLCSVFREDNVKFNFMFNSLKTIFYYGK